MISLFQKVKQFKILKNCECFWGAAAAGPAERLHDHHGIARERADQQRYTNQK